MITCWGWSSLSLTEEHVQLGKDEDDEEELLYPGHPVHPGYGKEEEAGEGDGADDPDVIVGLVLDYTIVARDSLVHQITVSTFKIFI